VTEDNRAIMRKLEVVLAILCAASTVSAEEPEVTAARAVFEQNIGAIRQRDRDRYLSLYLHDPRLVRGGPGAS